MTSSSWLVRKVSVFIKSINHWNGCWMIVSLEVILNKPSTCILSLISVWGAGLGCLSVEWFWPRSTSRRPLAPNGSLPWESPLSNAQLSSTSSASGWWVKQIQTAVQPERTNPPVESPQTLRRLTTSEGLKCVCPRRLLNSGCFLSTNLLLSLRKQVKADDQLTLPALF